MPSLPPSLSNSRKFLFLFLLSPSSSFSSSSWGFAKAQWRRTHFLYLLLLLSLFLRSRRKEERRRITYTWIGGRGEGREGKEEEEEEEKEEEKEIELRQTSFKVKKAFAYSRGGGRREGREGRKGGGGSQTKTFIRLRVLPRSFPFSSPLSFLLDVATALLNTYNVSQSFTSRENRRPNQISQEFPLPDSPKWLKREREIGERGGWLASLSLSSLSHWLH